MPRNEIETIQTYLDDFYDALHDEHKAIIFWESDDSVVIDAGLIKLKDQYLFVEFLIFILQQNKETLKIHFKMTFANWFNPATEKHVLIIDNTVDIDENLSRLYQTLTQTGLNIPEQLYSGMALMLGILKPNSLKSLVYTVVNHFHSFYKQQSEYLTTGFPVGIEKSVLEYYCWQINYLYSKFGDRDPEIKKYIDDNLLEICLVVFRFRKQYLLGYLHMLPKNITTEREVKKYFKHLKESQELGTLKTYLLAESQFHPEVMCRTVVGAICLTIDADELDKFMHLDRVLLAAVNENSKDKINLKLTFTNFKSNRINTYTLDNRFAKKYNHHTIYKILMDKNIYIPANVYKKLFKIVYSDISKYPTELLVLSIKQFNRLMTNRHNDSKLLMPIAKNIDFLYSKLKNRANIEEVMKEFLLDILPNLIIFEMLEWVMNLMPFASHTLTKLLKEYYPLYLDLAKRFGTSTDTTKLFSLMKLDLLLTPPNFIMEDPFFTSAYFDLFVTYDHEIKMDPENLTSNDKDYLINYLGDIRCIKYMVDHGANLAELISLQQESNNNNVVYEGLPVRKSFAHYADYKQTGKVLDLFTMATQSKLDCGLCAIAACLQFLKINVVANKSHTYDKVSSLRELLPSLNIEGPGAIWNTEDMQKIIKAGGGNSLIIDIKDEQHFIEVIQKAMNLNVPIIVPYSTNNSDTATDVELATSAHWASIIGIRKVDDQYQILLATWGDFYEVKASRLFAKHFLNVSLPDFHITKKLKWEKADHKPKNEMVRYHLFKARPLDQFWKKLIVVTHPTSCINQNDFSSAKPVQTSIQQTR